MKRLLRDKIAHTTMLLFGLSWGFSACSAISGIGFDKRAGFHHLSPAELKDIWHLPLIVTAVWSPIILWRAWAVLRTPRPATLPPGDAVPRNTNDRGPAVASGCAHIVAGLSLFFGIALACNFAGYPERWRAGVMILAVCALPLIVILFRLIWVRRALGRAVLFLDVPIRPGHSVTATYRRPLRSATLKSANVQLSCERDVMKHFGTRIWIPINRVLHEETVTPVITSAVEQIEIRMPFQVPSGSIGSSSMGNTTITWWLRVRLHMAGCPDTRSSFAIEVVNPIANETLIDRSEVK